MTLLRMAEDVDDFLRRPIGAGLLIENSFVWCLTPHLGGSTCWGAPTAEQTRRTLRAFEIFLHPSVAHEFDVVLDGRLMQRVDAGAALAFLDWTRTNLRKLRGRVRQQIGVAPPGLGAL